MILKVLAQSHSNAQTREIINLCESLCDPKTDYRGYINILDEKKRYYVFSIAHHNTIPGSVILLQILNGKVKLLFTRKTNYIITFIIIFSFLQLFDSL